MKKLVFTAIAMVAFCGASMANTITEEKETADTKKTTPALVVKILIRTQCDTLWIHWYEYALDELCAASGSQGAWDFADTLSAEMGC